MLLLVVTCICLGAIPMSTAQDWCSNLIPEGLEHLTPLHGLTSPFQPIEIGRNTKHICPGEPITVVLQSYGPTEFQSFVLQARRAGPNISKRLRTPIGKWTLMSSDGRTHACSAVNDTLTHADNPHPTRRILAQWTPPVLKAIDEERRIEMIATVVDTSLRLFTEVRSVELHVKSQIECKPKGDHGKEKYGGRAIDHVNSAFEAEKQKRKKKEAKPRKSGGAK